MTRLTHRREVVFSLLLAPSALAAPCDGEVALEAPPALRPYLVEALDLSGVRVHDGTTECSPARLSVVEQADALRTTLVLPDGRTRTIALRLVPAVASWTSSHVLTHRLDLLLAPVQSAEHRLVTLYPSLADLRDTRRTTTTEAVIDERAKPARTRVVRPLVSTRESKTLPGTYAFEAEGTLYVNHDAPRFHRSNRWGAATRIANNLVYPHQQCWWAPPTPSSEGAMQCQYAVALLDMTTGVVQTVGRAQLRAWWEARGPADTALPRPLDVATREAYLIRLLRHEEGQAP